MANTPLSADLTANIQRLLGEGLSQRVIAKELGVSQATVSNVKRGEGPAADHEPPILPDPDEMPVVVRDYRHLDALRLYPLGDVHKGSERHHANRWREWLTYLEETPGTSLLGTGDFLDAALKDSKSESYDQVMRVGDAKRELRRELAPLAEQGRLDGMMPGNHEDRIYRAVGDCPIRDLCDFLEVPYVQTSALFVYLVGSQTYHVYVRHGTGAGMSITNLAKGGRVALADIYVTGHTHQQGVFPDEYFRPVGKGVKWRVERRRRYYISSGSFLGYEKYAAARGYAPTRIGAPRIFLDGTRHDVHASI